MMDKTLNQFFMLVSTIINCVQSYEKRSVTFVQDQTVTCVSGITSVAGTAEITGHSRVFCATVCFEDPGCRSFFFNHIYQNCILRNGERIGSISSIEDNGWSHFIQVITPKTYVRMCYYTNWSQDREGDGKFLPKDIDPFLCTHIMYAYAELQNGKLTNSRANDLDSDSEEGFYSRVIALKGRNPSLKVLLSVGGPDSSSSDFSSMVSRQESRQTFVNSTITLCRQHGFDGFDMDWQYPTKNGGSPQDYKNFGLLIQELRCEFAVDAVLTGKDRLILTVPVSATKSVIDVAYDVATISRNVDYVLIQAYDFTDYKNGKTGHHSPLYPASDNVDQTACVSYAVEYWNEVGVPKSKIVVGMAAFGRTFWAYTSQLGTDTDKWSAPSGRYTRLEGFMSFYEVSEMYYNEGYISTDHTARAQYYYNLDSPKIWVSYEGTYSINYKVRNFIAPGGYAGAMIYALPLDYFKPINNRGQYPLVNEMKSALDAATNNK